MMMMNDDDENSLECEVALFCAALKAGHVAVHRHHVPETHRCHVQGGDEGANDDDDDDDDRPHCCALI